MVIVCVTVERACKLMSHAAHVLKAVVACAAQVMVLYLIAVHAVAHVTWAL